MTTREPRIDQIEVAIAALDLALDPKGVTEPLTDKAVEEAAEQQ
jgi:uncharacterized protein YqhQ